MCFAPQVADNISTFSILSTAPDTSELKLSVLDMSIVAGCFPELQVLSSMYSKLTATLDYLDETLKQVRDSFTVRELCLGQGVKAWGDPRLTWFECSAVTPTKLICKFSQILS